ncbi:hypothetical protein GCM10010307_84430 [Streptomyces vastus]|uniref:Uncharacterized protein n=1 Tax=Streptomyces vastus TaxID=285451 RepID=A0ABP6EEX8_9ACTN
MVQKVGSKPGFAVMTAPLHWVMWVSLGATMIGEMWGLGRRGGYLLCYGCGFVVACRSPTLGFSPTLGLERQSRGYLSSGLRKRSDMGTLWGQKQ